VLDIVGIESDLLVKGILITPIDLCHTRDPWLHRQYLSIRLSVELYLTRLMGSRSYE
jgi:hypothetical protein